MENFSPLSNAIVVEFECTECGFPISETIEELPMANMMADNVSDSENSDEEVFRCCECDKEYTCSIYVNQYEGNIEITTEDGNVIEDVTVEPIFDED